MSDDQQKYVIIGNGIAGTMAAETIRSQDRTGQITLLAGEAFPLYNRVALPRYLKADVPESTVLMRTVEDHKNKGIDLKLETWVESINCEDQVAITSAGDEFPYDKLLVATGGRVRQLPLEGADAENVYAFQTLDDTNAILDRLPEANHAVTIGGSYIAYELTEGLHQRGLDVTWLIRGSRFLRHVLDEEGGQLVDQIARKHGIEILYQEEATGLELSGGLVTSVDTKNSGRIETDMVCYGIGLNLNVELLEGTGVETGYGVLTDTSLRTSDPHIFAAGDVAQFYDPYADSHYVLGTWNNSLTHGRLAGLNMTGQQRTLQQIPSYSSTLFDSTITVMGLTPDILPGCESVTRCDHEHELYRKLFIHEGKLVGACVIGPMKGRRELLRLIQSRQELDQDPGELLDI